MSKQKLPPGHDYLFIVTAEGGLTRLSIEADGRVAATDADRNYPVINCRLLTPSQQNSGNPKEPRPACASGHHRLEAIRLPETDNKDRELGLVIWNAKTDSDTLLTVNLNYTLQIYQWPRQPVRSSGVSQ